MGITEEGKKRILQYRKLRRIKTAKDFERAETKLTFNEITDQAKQMQETVFVNWELSLKNKDDSELSQSDIFARDETLDFIDRLNEFISDSYFEAKSDYLESLLW